MSQFDLWRCPDGLFKATVVHVDTSAMAYTLERHGPVLTMMVTEPKIENSDRALADLKRHIDQGGITEVRIGYDEAAWQSGWAEHSLTALETSLSNIGIRLRVVGTDARLTESKRRL